MRKVMRIMCIVCVCLCLFRGLFGVVDPEGGFDIEPKLSKFVNAEVFSFQEELVLIQLSKFAFNNMVSPYNVGYGEEFTFYRVATWADPFYDDTSGAPNYTFVERIDLKVPPTKEWPHGRVQPVGVVRYVREPQSWWEVVVNFLRSFWDLTANVFRLLAELVYSLFEAIYEFVVLVLDIIFDVST